MGLRLMLRPLNGEQAMLFEDELFERSQRWKLSTSGLSAGRMFRGTGYVKILVSENLPCLIPACVISFGAMYEDGYGINCNSSLRSSRTGLTDVPADLAAPDMIKFGIESKFSSPRTSTDNLKNAIFDALSEMAKLCVAVDGAGALHSRL